MPRAQHPRQHKINKSFAICNTLYSDLVCKKRKTSFAKVKDELIYSWCTIKNP